MIPNILEHLFKRFADILALHNHSEQLLLLSKVGRPEKTSIGRGLERQKTMDVYNSHNVTWQRHATSDFGEAPRGLTSRNCRGRNSPHFNFWLISASEESAKDYSEA